MYVCMSGSSVWYVCLSVYLFGLYASLAVSHLVLSDLYVCPELVSITRHLNYNVTIANQLSYNQYREELAIELYCKEMVLYHTSTNRRKV